MFKTCFKMGKTCGKFVFSQLKNREHSSTESYKNVILKSRGRVQLAFFQSFAQVFFMSFSTYFFRQFAPVKVAVFRTFPHTYNNHYEVNKLER